MPSGPPPTGTFGGSTAPAPPTGGGFSRRAGGLGAPGGLGTPGGLGQNDGSATDALAYAKANGGASRFMLVVSSEQQASSMVIQGEHVASLGGFTGRETVLTPATLSRLVTRNEARYFLLGGGSGGPFGSTNAGASLIESVCAVVPTADWRTGTTTSGSGSSATLYDCSGEGAELATAGAATE